MLIFAHAGSLPRLFHFPRPAAIAGLPWRLFVDTGRSAPDDIHAGGDGPMVDVTKPLELAERSLICLVAEPDPALPRRLTVGSPVPPEIAP